MNTRKCAQGSLSAPPPRAPLQKRWGEHRPTGGRCRLYRRGHDCSATEAPSTLTPQSHMWVMGEQATGATGIQRTSTLLLEVPLEESPPLPTREAGHSGGLVPGAGPTGLDRWLERWVGFCSDNPAAFFL